MILVLVVPWRSPQNHAHWDRIRWVPLVSAPIGFADIVGNILLYMPFGCFAYLGSRDRRWVTVVIGGALLSCLTEASQIFGHGRFPSVQDVVMNVAGSAAGAALATSTRRNRESLDLS